jgi:hypothetical protein
LKEFWAYLWALNENLFPLGATTYPLTRGIKVEIAAIIVISLVGILSQIKLWKVIRDRRERRTTERLEDERSLEREEENVGKRIENLNAQDRDQWENVYGDKDRAPRSSAASQGDSGVGDMDSQKKGPMSTVTSVSRLGEDEIEMSNMQAPWKLAEVIAPNRPQDREQFTVRVARDLEPEPQNGGSESPLESLGDKRLSHGATTVGSDVRIGKADSEVPVEEVSEKRASNRLSNPPLSVRISRAPDVVPLPFKVPEGGEDDDTSSVATFADEDREGQKSRYLKHMSAGSAIMRRLSDRSMMSASPRSSKRFSMNDGPSTEDLVIPHESGDDGRSSVAATLDGLSDDEERSICSSMGHTYNICESTLHTGANDIKTEPPLEKPEPTTAGVEGDNAASDNKPPRTARSVASAAASDKSRTPSFTAAQLPPQLSKVVMSYRTNEWAKHLSNAEAPDLEELKVEMPAEDEKVEAAVPVNMEELQQTAGLSVPSPPRAQLSRSNTSESKKSVSPYASVGEASHGIPTSPNALVRNSSTHSQINAKGRLSTGQSIPHSITESPIEDSFSAKIPNNTYQLQSANVPFGSTNTLIGQRESLVRNKSFFSSTPDLPRTFPPQAHQNHPPQAHGNLKSMSGTQVGSDAGSIYHGHNSMSNPALNELSDDNISLSQRRQLIRQSSLQAPPSLTQDSPVNFDSHQPQRQSSVLTMVAREQQMASWRASVQQDLGSAHVPQNQIERQRSLLWQERQVEERKRAMDAMVKSQKNSAFDERMRRGDMLVAHRDALRKMQAAASKHA